MPIDFPDTPDINDEFSANGRTWRWNGSVWGAVSSLPIPGKDGDSGQDGPQGEIGPTGPQGENGPAGPQGSAGPTGPQGLQGSQGATGPVGAVGPTGPQGPRGPQGPQGFQGAAGPQGFAGVRGAAGARGPQGPRGPQGLQGSCASTVVRLTGNVSMSGTKTFTGQARGVDAWGRNVAAPRRSTWSSTDGRLGYSGSSIKLKQNIVDSVIDPEDVLKLRVVDFEYKENPDHLETGLIAEEVDETNLKFLVFREPDGSPQGIHYEFLSLATLSLAQKQQKEIEKISNDVKYLKEAIL